MKHPAVTMAESRRDTGSEEGSAEMNRDEDRTRVYKKCAEDHGVPQTGTKGVADAPARHRRRVRLAARHRLLATGLVALVTLVLAVTLIPNAAAKGGRVRTADAGAAEGENADTRLTLVLDAGHGGMDSGALSPDETVQESAVNLTMVNKLAALMEAHSGEVRVVLTREEDVFMKPAERAAIADAEGADLFLSLHLNSDYSSSVRGFQCFPPPPDRSNHEDSMAFARLLTAEINTIGHPLLNSSGIYYKFYVENAGGSYDEYAMEYTQYSGQYEGADSYGVLRGGKAAVLVEQWYLTNTEDMASFNNEGGMNSMAACLYRAVCAYFGLDAA